MADSSRALPRLQMLFEAARRIADPNDTLGKRARQLLPSSTGLSTEGIELALSCSLEHRTTRSELRNLARNSERVPRAHVLLSANVFVAALRAIALAVATSEHVEVRPSRREPSLAQLLAEGADGVFSIVDALAPSPGDHLWAYGKQETLSTIRSELPSGVVLHAHGPGFGAIVVQQRANVEGGPEAIRGIARDVALFDQRGCLSPRLVVLVGASEWARDCVERIVSELSAIQMSVPLGSLTADEAADVVRFRDTASYATEIWPAGKGWVSFDDSGTLLLMPPAGRCLHVVRAHEAIILLNHFQKDLTTLGLEPYDTMEQRFLTAFPNARLSRLGQMQCPPLDGPVDRRASRKGELL